MAVKRISQFPEGTPTANDKILFEQDGNGRSATIGDVGKAMSTDFFTIKTVPSARYIQVGKLVVVDFATTITGDVYTDLPNPHRFLAVTLRDVTDGNFSTFYMDSEAVLKTYKATNYVSGHNYSGTFVYLID